MWPLTWGERHWRRLDALRESRRINRLTSGYLKLQFAGGLALSAVGVVLLAKAIVTGAIPSLQGVAAAEAFVSLKLIAGGLALSGISSAMSHG